MGEEEVFGSRAEGEGDDWEGAGEGGTTGMGLGCVGTEATARKDGWALARHCAEGALRVARADASHANANAPLLSSCPTGFRLE
jgi:hypothetical protein